MSEPHDNRLRHLGAELARWEQLLPALATPRGSGTLPTGPGWTLTGLARHLGGTHRMVVQALDHGRPPEHRDGGPESDHDVQGWFRDGADQLLAALDTDPTRPAWSFDPEGRHVGFWRRRMLMETAVHRVDAETAPADRTPVAAEVSGDGVAEVLDTMVRLRLTEDALSQGPHAVGLTARGTPDRWVLSLSPPGAATPPVVGTVSARVEDLFLGLWKRVDLLSVVAVEGDASAVAAVLTLPLTP